MNNILVTYDLNLSKDSQDYDDIISEIKNCGNWASVNRSTWYVSTRLSCKEVYSRIKKVIDENDNIFVTKMEDASWFGLSKESTNHLHSHWKK